jgi:hypothetical protein
MPGFIATLDHPECPRFDQDLRFGSESIKNLRKERFLELAKP